MPESIDERREGWRVISTARIIEVIALEGRAPLREDRTQSPAFDMLQNEVRWDVGETDAVQCSVHCGRDVAQGKLTFHPHVELTAIPFEFPGVKPPGRWKPQVDAVMACQVLRD